MTTETYIGIQQTLARIIKGTEWEGQVYLVGGCVRDEIMQQSLHDIDLAVTVPNGGILFAQWLQKQRLLCKGRKPLIFEHFGTAKFRLREYPKEEIDCVQTRKGRYVYEEIPKPLENFGTIEEDAACRDLTINSLYRNITTGELLDPTSQGLSDIENHVIRTPNVPDISLRDNALHILRCIRFAVKFDWYLSEELIESMKRNIDILQEATLRRMTKELIAILSLKRKKRAFGLISHIGAMPFVEPYIQVVYDLQQKRKEERKRKYSRPKSQSPLPATDNTPTTKRKRHKRKESNKPHS